MAISSIGDYLTGAATSISNTLKAATASTIVPKDDEALTGLATSLPVIATTSETLSFFLNERLTTARVEEDVHIEKIIVLDNAKTPYMDALKVVDGLLINEVTNTNNTIQAVNDAYKARIDSGCKTDLFWRLTDYTVTVTTTAGPKGSSSSSTSSTYTYTCTRLNGGTPYPAVGIEKYNAWLKTRNAFGGRYGSIQVNEEILSDEVRSILGIGGTGSGYTGLSTTTVQYVSGPNGATQSVPLDSKFGLEEVNLYGIKLYDEPYTKDIGDTFITSFIGTCGIGTNAVIVMAPVNTSGLSNILPGQLLVCNKPNVFNIDAYEIVGIGTALADLTGIVTTASANALSSTTVLKLTLDENTVQQVFAPEDDGNYTTFTVLANPDAYANIGIGKSVSPYVPQTIKCPMTTSDIGRGVRIEFDDTGAPQGQQSWNQFLEGEFDTGSLITTSDVVVGYGTTVISGVGTTAIIGTIETSRETVYRTSGDVDKQITNNRVREPVLGGGKIFHKIGFDYAPVIYTDRERKDYRLAKEGEVVVLSYPMGTTPPNAALGDINFVTTRSTTSAGVEKLPSCSASVESTITTTVGVAKTTIDSLKTGKIADWREIANILRQDLTDLNLRIWSERQLLNDCKERQSTYSSRNNMIDKYSNIIDGKSTTL